MDNIKFFLICGTVVGCAAFIIAAFYVILRIRKVTDVRARDLASMIFPPSAMLAVAALATALVTILARDEIELMDCIFAALGCCTIFLCGSLIGGIRVTNNLKPDIANTRNELVRVNNLVHSLLGWTVLVTKQTFVIDDKGELKRETQVDDWIEWFARYITERKEEIALDDVGVFRIETRFTGLADDDEGAGLYRTRVLTCSDNPDSKTYVDSHSYFGKTKETALMAHGFLIGLARDGKLPAFLASRTSIDVAIRVPRSVTLATPAPKVSN